MKQSAIYIILLFFIYSCNSNQTNNAKSTGKDTITQCYKSVFANDSGSLVIKQVYGRISGDLNLYFTNKDNLTGKINGFFSGDTLYVDYAFQSGNKGPYFQNPQAFLRKDGKLYQGYGEIASTYGRTHFKKEVPIDFTKGFVFEPVDCK